MFGMEEICDRLKIAREKAGFKSPTEAATHFKWTLSTYYGHENGDREPGRKALFKYADAFNVDAAWLEKGNKNSIRTVHSTQKSDVIPVEVVPSSRHRNQQVASESGIIPENQLFTGAKDLPVYAASAGGDGHDIIDNDPIDYVKRPYMLEHVKDAYGMLQVNDSMIPEIRPGDVSLVNPRLPPNRNETYIFYQNDGLGGSKATTKHLVAVNDTDWTVEQWQPAKKFKLKRAEWPIAHRVVGKYSAR